MPKAMKYSQISKFLLENWFFIKRQTWSHVIFKNNKNRTVIVPKHSNKDIPWPTINSILKQAWLK